MYLAEIVPPFQNTYHFSCVEIFIKMFAAVASLLPMFEMHEQKDFRVTNWHYLIDEFEMDK
jgi:hypothetical protein